MTSYLPPKMRPFGTFSPKMTYFDQIDPINDTFDPIPPSRPKIRKNPKIWQKAKNPKICPKI